MARPSRTASTMVAKLSSARTMSAACARDVGAALPMAMPMCASRSAGASFTPSPVIATTWPRALNALHDAELLLGGDAGEDAQVHDARGELVVAHLRELGAGERLVALGPRARAPGRWRPR